MTMASSMGSRLFSRIGLRLSSGLTQSLNVSSTLLSPAAALAPATAAASLLNTTTSVRTLRWSAASKGRGQGSTVNAKILGSRSFHADDSSAFKSGVASSPSNNAAIGDPDAGQDIMDVIEQQDEQKMKETLERVNAQIKDGSYGRLFAVIAMEFHQHKITAGDLLQLNYDIGAPNGTRLRLDKALLIGSKDFTLMGRPLLPRDLVRITATVVEKCLSHTKVTFMLKRKERFRKEKYRFMRHYTTTLRINSIDLLKPVDQTEDRSGFEPHFNPNPLAPIDIKTFK